MKALSVRVGPMRVTADCSSSLDVTSPRASDAADSRTVMALSRRPREPIFDALEEPLPPPPLSCVGGGALTPALAALC